MSTVTARRWHGQGNVLDAIAAARSVLSPDSVVFVSTATKWLASSLATLDVGDDVFDLLVFDGGAQLRWLRRHDSGRIAVIALDDRKVPEAPPWASFAGTTEHHVMEREYLCWGNVVDSNTTSLTLAEPRLGVAGLTLPTDHQATLGTEVRLRCLELIGEIAHGNRRVVEQVVVALRAGLREDKAQ